MDNRVWPSDIHPESGSRLPPLARDELDDVGKRLFDHAVDPNGTSFAGLRGPAGIRLHSPRLAEALQPVGRYLRRDAGIAPEVRELAILVTAREVDSQFEWAAHQPVALKAGVSPAAIEIVRLRTPIVGLEERDEVVIRLGREMFGARRVSSETFARASELFGTRMLVDLVGLMGNYASTAALLCAFDVQLHDGLEPLLPVTGAGE